MISFLHTGDEHIDSDTHGHLNPATGLNTAWESNFRALRHLADTAAERGVDFFVSAGDGFKTGRPSQEALLLYVEALTPVANAGIPIVLLDGNHHMTGVSADHRTVIHVIAEMLRARGGTVHIASEPKLIRLDNGAQIAALPWLSKTRILNELDQADASPADGDRIVAEHGMKLLTDMAEEADSSAPLIMASHVTVDDVRIDAVAKGHTRGSELELAHLFSEPVLPRKGLEALPFQYGALSHIHTPQKMGDRYWYAGSPNRLTFTDMPDEKGGNLVTIDDAGNLTVERITTPARRMVSIDLDLDADTYRAEFDKLDGGTLVQVLLETGNPELPAEVRKRILDAGAIIAEARPRAAARVEVERTTLPETVDHKTALRTWAELNAPALDIDALLAAAERIAA